MLYYNISIPDVRVLVPRQTAAADSASALLPRQATTEFVLGFWAGAEPLI
jgi:hypothetical protein